MTKYKTFYYLKRLHGTKPFLSPCMFCLEELSSFPDFYDDDVSVTNLFYNDKYNKITKANHFTIQRDIMTFEYSAIKKVHTRFSLFTHYVMIKRLKEWITKLKAIVSGLIGKKTIT